MGSQVAWGTLAPRVLLMLLLLPDEKQTGGSATNRPPMYGTCSESGRTGEGKGDSFNLLRYFNRRYGRGLVRYCRYC